VPDRDRLLVNVSAAQLAFGVAGLTVALRRKREYHVLMLHGRVENLRRDAVVMGTAFSAPAAMLAAQAWATARLLRGTSTASRRDRRVLGILGAMMVPGYLGESLVRRRLHPSQWDPLESPLVVAGLSLAAAMAVVGLTARDDDARSLRAEPHEVVPAGA
jgi:hypothetical protein